ncbi:9676_t:CDS:1, partial [Scutellospora calospora]
TIGDQLESITKPDEPIVLPSSKTSILDNYHLTCLFKTPLLSPVQFKDKDFSLELLFTLPIPYNMATTQHILDYLQAN